MKAIFSVVGLLLVVAIVGVLAKRQLGTSAAPAAPAAGAAGVVVPTGTPKEQVQQFQKAVEGAMQAPPRPADDPK